MYPVLYWIYCRLFFTKRSRLFSMIGSGWLDPLSLFFPMTCEYNLFPFLLGGIAIGLGLEEIFQSRKIEHYVKKIYPVFMDLGLAVIVILVLNKSLADLLLSKNTLLLEKTIDILT